MWPPRGLVIAGCGWWCALASGLDSSALVQGTVGLHSQFGRDDLSRRVESTAGNSQHVIDDDLSEYLVDNSQLQHRGPGVLYRKSKRETDIAARDQYAEWGSTVQGSATDDGWVQVGSRFLPMKVRGAVVLVRKGGPPKPKQPKHQAAAPVVNKAIEIQSPDGSWIPASIIGEGTKPNTYNVVVSPRTMATYPIDDVPETALRGLSSSSSEIAEKPALATAALAAATDGSEVATPVEEAPEAEEGTRMSVKVEDFVGTPMDISFPTDRPVRVLMTMACDKLEFPRDKCTSDVQFIHHGRVVSPTSFSDSLDMKEGDTVYMLRRKASTKL